MSEFIIGFITEWGYLGIFLLMVAENLFPPIPSELIMPFAGYLASQGQYRLLADAVQKGAGLIMLGGHSSFGSGGWASTEADWRAFVEAWLVIHNRHRARAAASAA